MTDRNLRAFDPHGRVKAGERGAVFSFSGRLGAEIPAGAELYPDPVDLAVTLRGDLAICLYLPHPPAHGTGHPGARATTRVGPGDQIDAAALPDATVAPRTRVILAPGEAREVTFTLGSDAFALWNTEMAEVVEPGMFDIMVRPNSVDFETVALEIA